MEDTSGEFRTLPASNMAKKIMKELATSDKFKEQRDVWRLGAALGIVCGKTRIVIDNAQDEEKRETFQNVNSLDPDRILYAVMMGLHPEKNTDERFKLLVDHAEWGIREIYRKYKIGTLDWSTLGLFEECRKEVNERIEHGNDMIAKSDTNIEKKTEEDVLISPKTPFSNKFAFEKPIGVSEEYLFWVDKYFTIEGLRKIDEFLKRDRVKTIKILLSYEKANEDLRKYFIAFKEQMANEKIICEMRVIIDLGIRDIIHDRWIISKKTCYNVPSPDTVARGQYSEVKETSNFPPFNDWWEKGTDIITFWNEINCFKTKMERK
ncbi:MAG: hypothetical protein GYA51_00165 [Candidatus Methanofastidiosa archaeon]|nr:hypothetical protein [Candidatus Methanofastidiosa archaeon]